MGEGVARRRPWYTLGALGCPLMAIGLLTIGIVGSRRLGSGDSWGWGAAFVLVGLMGLTLLLGSVLGVVALMRSERPFWLVWTAVLLNVTPLLAGLSMTRL